MSFDALKNPTASAGFEPANLGTKGQHATPRPPMNIKCVFICSKILSETFPALIRHYRAITINVHRSKCKVTVILPRLY